MSFKKSSNKKEYTMDTKMVFGKHKGSTIKQILNMDPTYVTKFLMQDLQVSIKGINRTNILLATNYSKQTKKKVKDSCWGYDVWAGLVCNHSFYGDYVISKAPLGVVRIACKLTGLIVEGDTLYEAEHKLNVELDAVYGNDRSNLEQ